MNTNQRVLRMLTNAGPKGITVADVDGSGPILDGGRAIKRLAARINDLRNAGHTITTTMRSRNGVRWAVYTLIGGDDIAPVMSTQRTGDLSSPTTSLSRVIAGVVNDSEWTSEVAVLDEDGMEWV